VADLSVYGQIVVKYQPVIFPGYSLYAAVLSTYYTENKNWVYLTHLMSLAIVLKNTHIEKSN